jgi:ABC-2 type transport system permease protein
MMPIAMLLLFVYVFGGALGTQTGSVHYVSYITPAVIVLTVISGIAYAAYRLNGDIQKGIINRFRTMPVAPSSILGGQAASSTLSNLFSSLLVLAVALAIGFRSHASAMEWLVFASLTALFTLATTWMAIFFGLLAKSPEGAGSFSYILMLLIFISPSFVPTDSMTPALRAFAEHQPLTPIIETMRSLLVSGTAGDKAWIALTWCMGILVAFYLGSLRLYRNRTAA